MSLTEKAAAFEDIHIEADARALFEEDAPPYLSWDSLDATIKEAYRLIVRKRREEKAAK